MKRFEEAHKECPKCTSKEGWNIAHIGAAQINTNEQETIEMKFTCKCCGFSFVTLPADAEK
jgi:hypothetical protein